MKNLLQIILISLMLLSFAFADITAISSIQDVTGADTDESPLVGQEVTIQGIVSAESWAYGNSYYFVQDAELKWSGILVYDADRGNAYGDEVQITGTVSEYNGQTQISSITAYEKLDSMKTVEPILVTTGEIGTGGENAEAYEGVLVKVVDANITNADAGYGQWKIDDGSGEVMLDDEADYYFTATNYSAVKSVVGPISYSYGDHKILPRLALDIVEDDQYVRLQRIQQVRYSDLIKAFSDAKSDTSYLRGDTMSVKGIVTMPTGLSYAGDGIKFIFQQEGGGPWSSILSYHSDSTAYPQLFEGDLIEMTGYIDEYETGSANMTEFFITGSINILNFGLDTPPVDTILTGDLIKPITAEQWGNNMVVVKDVVVMDVDPGYELFSVDDGSGLLLIDDDSDDLIGYPDPALGAIFSSVEGWVYHHYGAYEDENTYKLCPLHIEDLIYGGGPPILSNIVRNPMLPTPADEVNISLDVSTNGVIENVDLFSMTNSSGFFTKSTMTDDGNGNYSGNIFQNADGDFVEYFIEATDQEGKTSTMPADTSKKMYGFVVRDGNLNIADIQYSPWQIADSPFDQATVTLTGIVTVDSSFKNTYGAYVMQDASAPWSGITLFGIEQVLARGDEIKITGQIEEYNDDYNFKWDNNTQIIVDSIEVLSSGNELYAPIDVTTGELNESPEKYEGVLVKVNNTQITSINSYDWSVNDGSGECLIDDDASRLADWFDALLVDDNFSFLTGPYIFSFGSYKIEIRDMNDIGEITDIDKSIEQVVHTYKLEQNFPNPFNPETRIYFEIPNNEMVTVAIYNVLGHKIRTLEHSTFAAGKHTLNWNGKNDFGQLVPTGTYIYRMKAGNFISTRKMMLMK